MSTASQAGRLLRCQDRLDPGAEPLPEVTGVGASGSMVRQIQGPDRSQDPLKAVSQLFAAFRGKGQGSVQGGEPPFERGCRL